MSLYSIVLLEERRRHVDSPTVISNRSLITFEPKTKQRMQFHWRSLMKLPAFNKARMHGRGSGDERCPCHPR